MKSKKQKIEIATPDEVTAYAGGSDEANVPSDPKADGAVEATNETTAAGEAVTAEALAAAREEAQQWKDKYLRAVAELQNFRRRSEQERSEALRYANAGFARSLVDVIDDFERALQHVAESDDESHPVAEAMTLIYDSFQKVLRQHDIEEIEAEGQPFDPNFHQAMMQQPSAEHSEPTVLQVVQKGYRLGDRVLRPAKVIVSQVEAGEEQPSDEAAADDAEDRAT